MADSKQNELIELTGLWKHTSQKGNTYYQGTLGGTAIMVMANPGKESGDKRPDLKVYIRQLGKAKTEEQIKTETVENF